MKKLYIFFLLALSTQLHAQFEKIYGSNEENRPTVVKAFHDGVYVAGVKLIGGAEFATFTKFNPNTGAIMWEKIFELQTHITDFDYEPATDEILGVGYTYPFSSTLDNNSFIFKITGGGTPIFFRRYNQPGREHFNRIIRHPNPPVAGFPFYITGTKNPSTNPSSLDVVVLFNIDINGTVNWAKEYAYSSNPTDDEFHRGLFAYGSDVILTGNVTNNDGALVRVNGITGVVNNAYRYPNNLDIYDGIELQNGFLMIVGEDFANNQAFIITLNPAFTSASGGFSSLRFSNIINFKDVWQDQFGKFYVIGESKNIAPSLTKNYQVVHKINYFSHAGIVDLSVDWARYLEDLGKAESTYGNGVISVTPTHDRIFYADARVQNPSQYGSWDMLVGNYDLNLGFPSSCVFDFPRDSTALPITPISITVTDQSINPTFTSPPIINPMMDGAIDFCATAQPPCPCDFTWTTSNCFQVQFDASCPNPIPGTYSYQWDFLCDGGLPDLVTNNPIASFTYPCGGGVFTACVIITDPFGNVCEVAHTITVPSTCCGQVNSTMITCGSNPNEYNYSVTISNPLGSTACACTVTAGTGVALGPYTCNSTASSITITGTALFTTPIVPLSLNLSIQTNCICPGTNLPYTCTLPVSIPTICCKTIAVADHVVCKDDVSYDVPIQVTNWPPLNNISQVSWYVQPKPASGICPATFSGTAYQDNLTNVLEPLHLNPKTLKTDLCIYVVVHLNDGPCTMLTSNVAMVTLCAPSTCDVTGIDTCYTGTPIVPGLLTLNLNSPANACPPTIDWYDPNGMLVYSGPGPYQPTLALSMANPANCYEDFFYTVRITDECGQRDCQARIRLYSSTAAVGTLSMDPFESQPFCPGEDATLTFSPACAGAPPKWSWHFRDCVGGPSSPIQGTGMMNPTFNTNKLYQSGWYIVEASNGVCPPEREEYKIEVNNPLAIVNFTAVPDPCRDQQVTLNVDFTPCTIQGCGTSCSCTHTVEWYLNGFLIGTTQTSLPTATFPWTGTPLAGNYYAIVKDDCCPNNIAQTGHIPIDPPCEPVILGPCFICDNTPVTLMAVMVVPPNKPCLDLCTYTWYDAVFDSFNNVWVPGQVIGTMSSLTVTTGGIYFLESDCNGCIKITQFHLLPCQSGQLNARSECGVIISVEELAPKALSPIRVYPNPTKGGITVEWIGEVPRDARLFLIDPMGIILRQLEVPDVVTEMNISMEDLPAGMYFIKIESAQGQYNVAKIVKE
jgi:hypothetical protein